MALEDNIHKLIAAVERLNASIDAILEIAPGEKTTKPAATATDDDEAPKRRGRPAGSKNKAASTSKGTEKKPEVEDADLSELKGAIGDWLGEYAKEEDKEDPDGIHPEVTARRAAIKNFITTKLEVKALKELTDEDTDKVNRLSAWFEKAKKVDKGHGKGRFVADPEPDDEDVDEDDDDEI